jgi:predicted DNA-binding transcriptional regulator AlpA
MNSQSVEQFCISHGISRALFYKLAAKGGAPKTFKIGRATRISATAAAEWLAEREAEAIAA